jgi:DNA-directed RNA polymerase alpha subunit
MSGKFDINIEEVETRDTVDLDYSSLVLKFSGKNVNEILTNTLRRIMLNDVPTYAFTPDCIVIEENTSVFNNDQIKVRISQLPIYNTPLDISYLQEKYWFDVDYASQDRLKHPSEKDIEINIQVVNNDENIKYVTTNDIVYRENGKIIKNKYNQKYPIVLLKLRPMQTLKCNMKAVLGVGERNAIWSAAGNSYHNIVFDKTGEKIDHILLYIESHGQFSEYELIYKACQFMQEKLEDTKQRIHENYEMESSKNSSLKTIEVTLDNESHTIGGLLINIMQDRDDVEYAGIGKKNELVKQITMCIRYKKETNEPLKPLIESVDYVIKMMLFVQEKIHKLGKKYIHVSQK